jgi:hypothetical protein
VKTKHIAPRFVVLLFAGLSLSFAACGGGGGGATQKATVVGTVLGTAVMAVDADTNAVVDSVAADLSTRVFSLQLPIGGNYKFYFLENEGTTFERSYPLYVSNQGQTQNVFAVSQANTIDLGFVDTASGAAVPERGPSQMESLGMSPVSFDSTVPSSLVDTFFTSSDMAGMWNIHGVADNRAWFHTMMTIGPSGAVNWGSPSSNNAGFQTDLSGRTTMSLLMMPGGVMNSTGDDDFNAFMGSGRSLFVATDLFPTVHQMFIAQKVPPPTRIFFTTDLCNNNGCSWQVQGIINGSRFNGWMQGFVTFDTLGNIVDSLTSITRNNGSGFSLSGTVTVLSDGEMSLAGTDFHGTMSDARDTIVATITDASSDACLLVLQRSASASHTNADFGGTWYMHNIGVVSSSAGGRSDYGAAHFDTSGNASMERFSTNSAFTTTSSSLLSFSMTLNVQGFMTGMSGFPGMMNGAMINGVMPVGMSEAGFSGFMKGDNSLFITNMTNAQGGSTNWNMMILQK